MSKITSIRPPRRYEPIWEEIKRNKEHVTEIRIKNKALYKRVKKAIIKEKDEDKGFKIVNDHDHFYLDFTYDEGSGVMRIKLKQSVGIEGVK